MITSAARGSWEEIAGHLRPFIARRVACAADVDDVLQDVLLKMVRGIGDLSDDDRFGPWVYRIARNAVADHRRRAARRRDDALLGDDDGPAVDAGVDPTVTPRTPLRAATPADDDRVDELLVPYVAYFVAQLPSPYREALTLVELEGVLQADAAKMLGVSVSGMKSRVQRGRAKLRAAFERRCTIALDARSRVVGCEPRDPSSCTC